MQSSAYGYYRTRSFSEIFPDAATFLAEYASNGVTVAVKSLTTKEPISTKSATILYYALYAKYGNSSIASSDENQFKYKLWTTIYEYGPAWEKRQEIQQKLRTLTDDEINATTMMIYNHAFYNGSEPAVEILPGIDSQNTTKGKRGKLEGIRMLWEMLVTDVTEQFLGQFKKLFIKVVMPQLPLWYEQPEG